MSTTLFLLEAAGLWLLAAVLVLCLRSRTAAARALVWRCACTAVVALPLLGLVAPQWNSLFASPDLGTAPRAVRLPEGSFDPIPLDAVTATASVEPAPAFPAPRGPHQPSFPWHLPIAWLWIVGAAVVFWPWLAGRLALGRAWRRAVWVEEGTWTRELARLSPRQEPRLALVPGVSVPMLWCSPLTGAACLALPSQALSWPAARVRSVLLHELAHLERGDGRARLLARLALALSWPIPIAWWGHRRMRMEAERACDDAALAAGTPAADYAGHLLDVALDASAEGRLETCAPAMVRRAELDTRVALVLDRTRLRRPPARTLTRAAGLAVVLSVLPLTALGQDQDSVGVKVRRRPGMGPALERGLDWLVAAQDRETGSWSGDIGFKLNTGYRVLGPDMPHVGVTAIAIQALLDGGAVPGEGSRGKAVVRGARFLVTTMRSEPGYAQFAGTRMKSHALAVEVLARLYGMTESEDLGAVLREAVAWTVKFQNNLGGWRYGPIAQDSDILHTASMLRALDAVENAGIDVPPRALDRARDLVEEHRREEPVGFGYQATEHSRVTAATTAAGLVALRHQDRLDRAFRTEALASLTGQLGRLRADFGDNALVWHTRDRVARALMVWAVDAEGRARWNAFRGTVRDELRRSQGEDGSWSCEGGPGPAYSTAVACRLLTLEPAPKAVSGR